MIFNKYFTNTISAFHVFKHFYYSAFIVFYTGSHI